MELNARTKLFCVLLGIFLTCLLVGDIIGGKLLLVRPFGYEIVFSAGMLPFPITFLLTDVMNEFYGKKAARFATLVAFGMALLTVFILVIAGKMPWWNPITQKPDWTGMDQSSFNRVFSSSLQILLASIAAFVIAQFVDIGVFNVLKKWTANRYIWLRATGSTIFSQLIDTFVVQILAWSGKLSLSSIFKMVLTWYLMKLIIAIALTPAIYACHGFIEKFVGVSPIHLKKDGSEIHSS